jgi:haloalkane dehalogenase
MHASAFSEYPFASRWLDLGGVRMHYLDEGPPDGPPVLMLHGNPTWSFYYRRLVAALRDRFRVIVPDHVGMGLSDKPADRDYHYTLSQRVRDTEQLLQRVADSRPLTLVVHDWGGMIGLALAAKNPSRIARLVVFNSAAFRMLPGKRLPWQLRVFRARLVGPLLVQGANAFCRGALARCVAHAPLSADVRRGYLAPYDSWSHRRAVLRFVQDIPLSAGDPAYELVRETESRLSGIACPTFIGWGMRDFVFDADYLAAWEARFPSAEVHRFADAGHYVLEDAAAELVPLVRRFLER